MNQLSENKKYVEWINGDDNMIIWANSASFANHPLFKTPYLFLGNSRDKGHYQINCQKITVSKHLFYMLNPGDELEINLRRNRLTDTVIIAFSNQVIQCVSDLHEQPLQKLLDNFGTSFSIPESIPPIPFEYTSEILAKLINIQVKDFAARTDREVFFHDIADSLLIHTNKEHHKVKNIYSVHKSTREELYRRVLIGRTFMNDTFTGNIMMDSIAKEACINKFYFIKLFRAIYGITPHQYITKLKLNKAQELLSKQEYRIGEICQLVGFESVGTFTNLFKKHFGATPSEYRRSTKNSLSDNYYA